MNMCNEGRVWYVEWNGFSDLPLECPNSAYLVFCFCMQFWSITRCLHGLSFFMKMQFGGLGAFVFLKMCAFVFSFV